MYLLVCLYSYAKSRLISILTNILLTKLARMASHQQVRAFFEYFRSTNYEDLLEYQELMVFDSTKQRIHPAYSLPAVDGSLLS